MAILVVRCSRKHTVGVAVFPAGSSYRVTTYLVNLMAFDRLLLKGLLTYLLMSWNLTAVRKVSRKKSCLRKVV